MRHHMGRRAFAIVMSVAAVFAAAGLADAGTIDSVTGAILPPGPSSAVIGSLATPSPNNDNSTTASPNSIELTKTFGSIGTLDLRFSVSNSGGTTEYLIDESVRNNTGLAWTDYHFELGFGLGQTFVPSSLFDFLDFDAPQRDPAPTSSAFATLDYQSNSLAWSGGAVPNGADGVFRFSIDVPDYSSAIPAGFERRDATGAIIGYEFTLRQFPTTVPEPTSIVLLGVGLSGLMGSRRLRRR